MDLFMTNRAEYLISWFAVARIDAAMRPIESGSFTRMVVAAISMVFSLAGARVSQMWISGAGTGHGSADEHRDRRVRPDPRDTGPPSSSVGINNDGAFYAEESTHSCE